VEPALYDVRMTVNGVVRLHDGWARRVCCGPEADRRDAQGTVAIHVETLHVQQWAAVEALIGARYIAERITDVHPRRNLVGGHA